MDKPIIALRKPSPKAVENFVHGSEVTELRQVAPVTCKQIADYQRSTYYLRPEQIRAMKLRAVTEDRNVSELVREAFDRYLENSPGNS